MTRPDLNQRHGFADAPTVKASYPWRMVTGLDFGRAIKWAKGRKNAINEAIKAKLK